MQREALPCCKGSILQIFAYIRETGKEKLLVICNFYGEEAAYPDDSDWKGMQLLLNNYETDKAQDERVLRPYEARYYYWKEESGSCGAGGGTDN